MSATLATAMLSGAAVSAQNVAPANRNTVVLQGELQMLENRLRRQQFQQQQQQFRAQDRGVRGKTLKQPAGTYSYWKRLTNRFVRVDVTVYLLAVTEELANWQEAKRRQRAWLAPEDAAVLIDEPDLSTLLKNLKIPQPAPAGELAPRSQLESSSA
ncbi:MAG: hypothetical protein E5Y61_12155 [Mesorhizobium sp.]|nr:MAG: hypothetical protein E5Y61_12155 [Mesorhizobium sp.]